MRLMLLNRCFVDLYYTICYIFCKITVDICSTVGLVLHHIIFRSVKVLTCYRYGVCGFGYSVEKPDPGVTHVEPYSGMSTPTVYHLK